MVVVALVVVPTGRAVSKAYAGLVGATDQPKLVVLAVRVRELLAGHGFAAHLFIGGEDTREDWRRRGPLVVVRRDHLEVWWSVGPRSGTQTGPTRAEQRMTPILLEFLAEAGFRAAMSIPTRDGDTAVWITS